jgi:uncharacterized protein
VSVEHRLPDPAYLAFPLRVGRRGAATSSRAAHVRELILQTVLTEPAERVFRPEWGVGGRRLVFEPAGPGLEELTRKRLQASLLPILEGEVDPDSLRIDVAVDGPELRITIAYQLATIGVRDRVTVVAGPEGVRDASP